MPAPPTRVVGGCDVVVHTAAIPQPIHNPPHVVFGNNMLSTFNVLEAAIAGGVRRFVNFSSETVPGFIFAHRPFRARVPADRRGASGPAAGPVRDREVVRRAPLRPRRRAGDIRCTSIRPCWVQDEDSYERNLGPIVRDPSVLIENYCSYVDVHDLCDAVVLAIETDLPGHEVFYIASPDTIGGHPLVETVQTYYGGEGIEFRPLEREDASAISQREGGAPARLGAARGRGATTSTSRGGHAREDASARATPAPSSRPSGFGAWAIGGPWRFGWGDVDDDDSIAAIRHAIELGVNWIDTAAVYGLGHSEEVVGRALTPLQRRRGRARLHEVRPPLGRATRGRHRERPATRVDPRGVRARALRRLGVERIDLYQFHWPDWTTGTAARGLLGDDGGARRRRQGALDRRVPTSTWSSSSAARRSRHVDSLQPPLSLLARGARATVLPWAAAHGTGVIVLLAAWRPACSPAASTATGSSDSIRHDWRRTSPPSRTRRFGATSTSSSGSDRFAEPARRDVAGARGRLDARAARA